MPVIALGHRDYKDNMILVNLTMLKTLVNLRQSIA